MRTRLRNACRRTRPCFPWPGYPKAIAITALLLACGLSLVVWFFVDPVKSAVLVAPALELQIVQSAGSDAVIALDPAVQKNESSGLTHTLELSRHCDRLALRAQQTTVSHQIVVRPFRREKDRERSCDFTTARLTSTKNPLSLDAAGAVSLDLSGGASVALVAKNHVFSGLSIRSIFVPSVESNAAASGSLAEVLTGKSIAIEAKEWRLTRLDLLVLNDKPMLQATLDAPRGVTRLIVNGKNALLSSRFDIWWSWFWALFGAATLLDFLKLGCVQRLFSRGRRKVP